MLRIKIEKGKELNSVTNANWWETQHPSAGWWLVYLTGEKHLIPQEQLFFGVVPARVRTIQTVTKAGLTPGLQWSGTIPRHPQGEEQHCGSQCRLCTFCRKVSFSLSWNGLISAAGVSARLVNMWGVLWLKEWVPCVRLGVVDRTGRQNEWEGERDSHRETTFVPCWTGESVCVCDGWVRTCARKKLTASLYHRQDSIHLYNVFSMRSHVFAYRGFWFIGCQKVCTGKVSYMACRNVHFFKTLLARW